MIRNRFKLIGPGGCISWFLIMLILAISLGITSDSFAQPPDIPFGITINAANHPNETEIDAWRALMKAGAIASHGSFIWNWSFQAGFEKYAKLVPVMHKIGLKSFVQFSPNFIGSPAPPSGVGVEKSYADSDVCAKYLEDIERLANLKPNYLVVGTEINLMYYFHRKEFFLYAPLYRQAYDLVKSISPDTKVGVSYIYRLFVFDKEFFLPDYLGPHDFIAFSSYPDWWVEKGFFSSSAEFPADYYTAIRQVFPDTPIIFSEIGWPDRGDHSSLEEQAIFVSRLPELMEGVRPDLIIWTLLHDTTFFKRDILDQKTIDFLESLGLDISKLFGGFNSMGICNLDGTFKPAWDEAVKLDFSSWK